MIFSESELSLLRDLKGDPRWGSILDKLMTDRLTRWKPGKTAEDWAYVSGRIEENDRILNALKGA